MTAAPALSSAQLALLQRRLAGHGSAAARITRLPVGAPAPLSFAQERLWFLDRLEDTSSAYVIPLVYHLRGDLDVAALQAAVHNLVQRHAILRSGLGDGTTTVMCDALRSLPLVLVRNLDTARRCARSLADRPFDLARGPLMRAALLRLSSDDHVLVIVLHHAVVDAWSLGVLWHDLSSFYRASVCDEPAVLKELRVQYADVAAWQRQQSFAPDLEYWQGQLARAPLVFELPADRERPARQSYAGAWYRLDLSREIIAGLEDVGRQERATLFMVVLTAYAALLHRYTGRTDFIVGSPIAGRTRPEMEPLIGLFVNSLGVRIKTDCNPSLRELLRQVRETCLDAYAHQELPFEKLVEVLQPPRDLSRTPVFQVMFQLQANRWTAAAQMPGLQLEEMPWVAQHTAKVDLSLDVVRSDDGMRAIFEYATALFDSSTIERMAAHFLRIATAFATNPDQRIGDIPMLTNAERQTMLVDWNANVVEVPNKRFVQELVDKQALATPREAAVVGPTGCLTYAELRQRSDALAARLQAMGIGPECRVGICMERSPELFIAVLGVLKAGGAYVLLDPTFPAARLECLRTDANISIVLTGDDIPTLSTLPAPPVRAVELHSDNAAYVIYTSGSTGRPKGVVVTHRNLLNATLAWHADYQLSTTAKTHLQMAGVAFDVFTGDMMRALTTGARLVLCPRETLLDPAALYELMLRQGVDCAEFVPSVLRELIAYVADHGLNLAFMRLLVVGSEHWSSTDWQSLSRVVGQQTRLVNSYGLTETTIDSTFADQPGSIGRAFANTSVFVLDAYGNPAPVGIPGELHIGGANVARGYLERPDLTAERFVPDAASGRCGRLYRTGDRARWRPDGTLELLGRIDNQLKVRGVRLEPAEIEAVLRRYPAVDDVAVTVREERLVAFFTAADAPPSPANLRAFARLRLPDTLVPSAYVELKRLPRLASGKLDRSALRASPVAPRVSLRPLTADEARMAALWSGVLNIEAENIGPDDDFFALGGHSLLAMRVMSQVRLAFNTDAPLRALFEEPVLGDFTRRVARQRLTAVRTPVSSVVRVARDAYRVLEH